MAPRPSAAPLILCLDFHMHTPDESERIGSSHGNMEDSESPDTGSPCGNTDDSEFQGADDSESESRSSCAVTAPSIYQAFTQLSTT